jgi:hypothetical protein
MLIIYSALCALIKSSLSHCFPNFLNWRNHWQPISLNVTFHTTKMYVINIVAAISDLYGDVCAPKCPDSYPGWESLV